MKDGSKAIIGIVGTPVYDNEGFSVIALYEAYKNVVIQKDCIPFMICPLTNIDYYNTKLEDIPAITNKEQETYMQMIDMCDGLIIPGGYRIYNFHEFIVKYALEKDIPIFGICMGMQLLANIDNNYNCVVLNETEINHKQTNQKYAHKIKILDGTLLKEIVKKDEIEVNSNHKYHITKVNNFIVSAYSKDGLIEAIECSNKNFVIGLQWHPEKMVGYDLEANKIFDRFILECSKTKVKSK